MRKTLTIATKEVIKQGFTNGRAWELSNVTDMEAVKYSTFASLVPGQTYDCEVVPEPSKKINPRTGTPYLNQKIAKVYGQDFGKQTEDVAQRDAYNPRQTAPQKETKEDQILKGLREIYKQNEKILEKLEGLEGV